MRYLRHRQFLVHGVAASCFIEQRQRGRLVDIIGPLQYCRSFGSWLERIGYVYCSSDRLSPSFEDDYELVKANTKEDLLGRFQDLSKRSWDFERGGALVRLSGSLNSPIGDEDPDSQTIAFFMDIIVDGYAYCLFPQSSLIDQELFLCRPAVHESNSDQIRKQIRYARDFLGKRTRDLPSVEAACATTGECSFKIRHFVGDAYSLCVEVTGTGEKARSQYAKYNSWSIRYSANWMSMSFGTLRFPNIPVACCVTPEQLKPLRGILKRDLNKFKSSLSSIITEHDFAKQLIEVQDSIAIPLKNLSVDHIVQRLLCLCECKADHVGSIPPEDDLLDPYMMIRISQILHGIAARHDQINIVHLVYCTTIFRSDYLQAEHFYERDEEGNEWLNINIHILLQRHQKPNEFHLWNREQDVLAAERISLRFKWSWTDG
ncbi:hypothetical protein GYMLUDRAFT_57617 [Collybiopsis luxurians FD-317 M1]|uniref:Uncharacterized protein n=1 Tax=Collybiopsis luxurians FD-317 M1 TaxID=944289 RepID=A0A0D0D2G9_9AGAR|nr:hypothetical protein GYMLUDRAFT_57617 [Collybiopsis luxurians FD-317 M1]